MERTSKEEVNIPSIKEIRLERRRLARQNRKRRIFFNTTITWDGTNRTGVLTSLTGNQEDGNCEQNYYHCNCHISNQLCRT